MSENNPFFSVSLLPYQAPRFDVIDVSHYRPAFDEGVRRQRAEIAAIVNHPQPADFANTLEALEQSGQQLARVTNVFFAMAGAETNPTIQALGEGIKRSLAAAFTQYHPAARAAFAAGQTDARKFVCGRLDAQSEGRYE